MARRRSHRRKTVGQLVETVGCASNRTKKRGTESHAGQRDANEQLSIAGLVRILTAYPVGAHSMRIVTRRYISTLIQQMADTAAIRIHLPYLRDFGIGSPPMGLPGERGLSPSGLSPGSASGITEYRFLCDRDFGVGIWWKNLPRITREIPDSRHTNTIELRGRSAQQWDSWLAGRLAVFFPRTSGSAAHQKQMWYRRSS